MQPRVKWGLIIGAVGFVLNICADVICGLFGPALGLVGGALAGWLTAREERVATKGQGAQYGLIAGSIAGVGTLIGRVISGGLALILYEVADLQPLMGPPPSDTSELLGWWAGACCFALIGLALSGGAGALLGYLMSKPESSETAPTPMT